MWLPVKFGARQCQTQGFRSEAAVAAPRMLPFIELARAGGTPSETMMKQDSATRIWAVSGVNMRDRATVCMP